jgi:hypothetical protein
MRRLGETRHEIAVADGPIGRGLDILAARQSHFRPTGGVGRYPSAAARIFAAWQIAAIGLFASANDRTIAITRLSSRRYSGARPPAIISASSHWASLPQNWRSV